MRLSNAGVRYCHWKSNDKIGLSETGDNDLDILVQREDISKFKEILFGLGFKHARFWRGARSRPGVEDYYGYDIDANRIIHVHAHYQLIIGNDATKSFRLPVEHELIESATYQDSKLLPTPRSEFELIVFCVRMILKWTLIGAIGKKGRVLSAAARNEFEYLHKRCDMQVVHDILRVHFPTVSDELFLRWLNVLNVNYAGIAAQYWLYNGFRRSLSHYSMNGRLQDVWMINKRRFLSVASRFAHLSTENRRFPTGGVQVAIVGGDGAGKTTAVSEIQGWLSRDFDVMRLHLGKPRRSAATLLYDAFLRLSGIRKSFPKDSAVDCFPGYCWMMRMVLYARDRYLAARQGALSASKGSFVIYDRFPMRRLSEMDTLCCGLAVKFNSSLLSRALEKLEVSYFSRINMPDYMLFLKVDPSVAVARKGTEDPEYVRIRNEEIYSSEWIHDACEVINANQDKIGVLNDIKRYIWKIL